MNSPSLDQLLKFLADTLQEGKEFSVEQAPQFVRELLVWRFYQAAVLCCVGVFIIVLGAILGQYFSGFWDKTRDGEEHRNARWIPSLAGLIIGAIIIGMSASDMIQIKVAPRVVVVEMVRGLLAGQR